MKGPMSRIQASESTDADAESAEAYHAHHARTRPRSHTCPSEDAKNAEALSTERIVGLLLLPLLVLDKLCVSDNVAIKAPSLEFAIAAAVLDVLALGKVCFGGLWIRLGLVWFPSPPKAATFAWRCASVRTMPATELKVQLS